MSKNSLSFSLDLSLYISKSLISMAKEPHSLHNKHHHANMFMKKKTTTSFLLWLLIVISFILLLSLITTTPLKPQKDDHHNSTEPVMDTCDAYNGTWVRELYNKVVYTNATCPSLPESKNCAKYGKESEFLRWRWKPHGCDDVPRFDPTAFLDVVRGRRMAFVGDSVARNQMDSLLCLLSQVSLKRFQFFLFFIVTSVCYNTGSYIF